MSTGWRTPSDWPATPTGLTGTQVEEALAELGTPPKPPATLPATDAETNREES